ncbi:MAG TPA: ATP-binding protein [Candidatus Eisenbacteria bacterium]
MTGASTRNRPRGPSPEALARALMEDAETGVLLLDPSARLKRINGPALRLLSLSEAQARGQPASRLLRTAGVHDDLLAETRNSVRSEREGVLVARDGSEVPVLVRSYRLGRPPWTVLTLRDLTQSRRLREELRRHERLATLGKLSAGVAHEIRNPLAGIGTSAQVLLRRFEPRDERARFVRVILDEVARLDRIVTSLLQYARPRTPELKPCALAACVERVLELSRDALAGAGVTAEVDVAPRIAPVYIDDGLVTQVLLNVTLNSIQAMPQGGALRYEIRNVRRRPTPRGPGRRAADLARASAPGRREGAPRVTYQQVRVTDNGAGMSRGVLAKLFDPFFSTKPQGTGLGLSISQTIMQEHGGTIEVLSRERHGTTVLLNFPVEKRHGERRQPDPRSDRAHAAHR